MCIISSIDQHFHNNLKHIEIHKDSILFNCQYISIVKRYNSTIISSLWSLAQKYSIREIIKKPHHVHIFFGIIHLILAREIKINTNMPSHPRLYFIINLIIVIFIIIDFFFSILTAVY